MRLITKQINASFFHSMTSRIYLKASDTFSYRCLNIIFFISKNCDYRIDNLIDGWIEISKYDINKSIVSATFEFTAYNSNCADTLKVTEGRFDIGEIIF